MSGALDARLRVRPADFRLPPGRQLSRGVIGGTPMTRGTFTFTIGATDSRGTAAAPSFSIPVVHPPARGPPPPGRAAGRGRPAPMLSAPPQIADRSSASYRAGPP